MSGFPSRRSPMHAALRQAENNLAEIIEVPSQPIHRVTIDCVVFAHESQHGFQLRTVRVLTRSVVRTHTRSLHPSRRRNAVTAYGTRQNHRSGSDPLR